jgi:hypothetical protein
MVINFLWCSFSLLVSYTIEAQVFSDISYQEVSANLFGFNQVISNLILNEIRLIVCLNV